jgi:hypothetical protein
MCRKEYEIEMEGDLYDLDVTFNLIRCSSFGVRHFTLISIIKKSPNKSSSNISDHLINLFPCFFGGISRTWVSE